MSPCDHDQDSSERLAAARLTGHSATARESADRFGSWRDGFSRERSLALTALAIFGIRIVLAICTGWNTADEAWMLQVICRTGHGEVLFRDVFFNAMPLPVYLGRAACFLFGYSALTLKILCAAIDTGVFVVTHRLLRILDRPVAPWRLGMCMLLGSLPLVSSLYSGLAILFMMLAAGVFLRWRMGPTPHRALWAGLLTGLTAASKHNLGVYLVIAGGVSMLWASRVPWARRLGHAALSICVAPLVVLLVLLPTIFQRAWTNMITFAIDNKTQYIRLARVNFFSGFEQLLHLDGLPHFPDLNLYVIQLILPLALLAAAAGAGMLAGAPRRRLLPVLPFFLVLAAGVFPRADANHVAQAGPAIFGTLFLVTPALPGILRKIAWIGTALAVGLLAALLLSAGEALTSPNWTFTRLPHLRGVLLDTYRFQRLRELTTAARRQPRPVFVLSTEASAFYLVAGLQNPTPYDYPLANEFPPGSQEIIADDLRAGRIQTVIVNPGFTGPLMPQTLRQAVTDQCPLVETIQGYEIRHSPASAPAPASAPSSTQPEASTTTRNGE